MALTEKHDPIFEQLWQRYPKWPKGRSIKREAAQKWDKANKLLAFTAEDIEAIEGDIGLRKLTDEKWQAGNQYGPVSMQRYIHNHMWNEPFITVKDTKPKPDRYETTNREQDADRGMTDEQRAAARVAYEQYKADTRAVQ